MNQEGVRGGPVDLCELWREGGSQPLVGTCVAPDPSGDFSLAEAWDCFRVHLLPLHHPGSWLSPGPERVNHLKGDVIEAG